MTTAPRRPATRLRATRGPVTPTGAASTAVGAGAPAPEAVSSVADVQGRASAFLELMKLKVASLLVVTCVGAMACAARGVPDLGVLVATVVGLTLSSGGASALNHVFDRDIDARMARTARRPVVTGVVTPREGTAFGIALMALSFVLLATTVNVLTASLALAGGLFYIVVYTMLLKRYTVQNIVIGGAAGAIPPLVGWAAVTGQVGLLAWVLFGVIFLWTPPHFWALALLIRDDYEKAGVPMLPVVGGDRATARQVWWYSVVLVAFTLVPVATGDLGVVWLVASVALGGRLLQRAWTLRSHALALAPGARLAIDGTAGRLAARRMFLFSMGYLGLLFVAAVVDRATWFHPLT